MANHGFCHVVLITTYYNIIFFHFQSFHSCFSVLYLNKKSKENSFMGFLAAFMGFILLLVLFVVAVTVSTVTGTFGAIADDMNEDKG